MVCEHCRLEQCFCAKHKFVAEILLTFKGENKDKVNEQLGVATKKIQAADVKANSILCDLSAKENTYTDRLKHRAVDALAGLALEYNWSMEEIAEYVHDMLEHEVHAVIEQSRTEAEADTAYEKMKEEEFLREEEESRELMYGGEINEE